MYQVTEGHSGVKLLLLCLQQGQEGEQMVMEEGEDCQPISK